MHHRRSQGDSKSTSSISGSISTAPPTTTNNVSSTSTTGRVSIYSMRERVILNKMTRMMGKLAPDTETEITSRLHQEIPAIPLDSHLTYCLYITLQNLIHINAIYILLYHAVFWLSSNSYQREIPKSSEVLEHTPYEETHFLTYTSDHYSVTGKSIHINLINKYLYLTLIGIGSFELLIAFIWTMRKKLPYLIQRNQNVKYRLGILLIGMIIIIYASCITWLVFHTFITHHLTVTFFFLSLTHLILLTLLDKPNLFSQSPYDFSKQSTTPRKQYRNSTSSSSTSFTATSIMNRLSYRLSVSMQSRKVNPIVNSTALISWSRWSSITEEKFDVHECTTFYEQARQEADDLWLLFVRRIALTFYRTCASFILFDIVPINIIANHVLLTDSISLKMLIGIFTLGTFLTHSAFLFPVKFQTTLHRIATHLGQWRQQSNIRTDTINEWSSECNTYKRGSVVKLSSHNQQHFIAVQHVDNAANPQSKSHFILYYLFGDATYFLNIQFVLSIVLVLFHIIWIIRGRHWEQIVIGSLTIMSVSYPIFKIARDRIIMDCVEEQEFIQTSTISKQKKSS